MINAPLGVDDYVAAATAPNTRRSYKAAIAHFEVEWGGFLPATADSVARYLVDFAATLAPNTLRQRLAALAQWHTEQGFPDPTKAPLVKKTLKGIQTLHPVQEKRAKPLQIEQLDQLVSWLNDRALIAAAQGRRAMILKVARDKALLLMGFWRGFRSDELGRLRVEHIEVAAGEGMTLFLSHTKTERSHHGRHFKVPALSRLCPVAAYQQWITHAALSEGPVFRRIDRWGRIAEDALHANSFIPLIRDLFSAAGIPNPDDFSSHSLRRGFATWASMKGWDIKMLMEYVGWRDVSSALKYIEGSDPFAQQRIESALSPNSSVSVSDFPQRTSAMPLPKPLQQTVLELRFSLERHHAKVRGKDKARKAIESCCLKRYQMQPLDRHGFYRLHVEHDSADHLDECIDTLFDEMYQIAATHSFFIDASVTNPVTQQVWS